jgi:hypothetical protein
VPRRGPGPASEALAGHRSSAKGGRDAGGGPTGQAPEEAYGQIRGLSMDSLSLILVGDDLPES